jgi:hypothetical protein
MIIKVINFEYLREEFLKKFLVKMTQMRKL